jgi:hypothetical protein
MLRAIEQKREAVEAGRLRLEFPEALPPQTAARCLWTVEASSWEAAQAAKHDFLGWEPYQPLPDKGTADPTS